MKKMIKGLLWRKLLKNKSRSIISRLADSCRGKREVGVVAIDNQINVVVLNCHKLRGPLGDNSTAHEKYDTEYEKIHPKALEMKKGLSEDSPRVEIYEFSEFLRVINGKLRELAQKLMLQFGK